MFMPCIPGVSFQLKHFRKRKPYSVPPNSVHIGINPHYMQMFSKLINLEMSLTNMNTKVNYAMSLTIC
ncbi:hypothetical protein PRUPE_5G125400 [Prunus persica]|uniref:Uncharacterized protein n=1 Tax=Prunus persica TaxID=3760 RepID=A0A251P7G9_PRUPE|nr:hypothetical protein PRUPE_5G125400 [Prunus persica]